MSIYARFCYGVSHGQRPRCKSASFRNASNLQRLCAPLSSTRFFPRGAYIGFTTI